VHGGTAGVTLKVSCQNLAGKTILTPVSITVPKSVWQTKSILMSQLANVPFVSINFTAGSSKVTFYLDEIGLVYTPAGYAAKLTGVEDVPVPQGYGLLQNYPNPFNPSTTIRYTLPVRSRVTLDVYTPLGQLVERLVDAEQDAGFGQAVWNADVTTGVYFYSLEATSIDDPAKRFNEVRSMLLLK